MVRTPPRPLIQDIDPLPWPDYDGVEMDKYVDLNGNTDGGGLLFSHHDDPRMVPIMTSRGCPFKCTFCCYELIETKYRARDLDDVMAEVEHLIERFGINTLFISDDLFSLKKSRMMEFCERIKPLNLNWQCSLRVKPLERETLEIMRDAAANGKIVDKVAFLEKCEYEINVTDIPDAAYTEIENYINFLSICIDITGRITSLSEQGNNRMVVETECPHCQAPNKYKKVFKRSNSINWISCRRCSARYKIPLSVVVEITPAIIEPFELPVVDGGAGKLEAYQEIAKKPHPHHRVMFELGKCYLEQGDTPKSLSPLQRALKINPCNTDYQRKYAEALQLAGLNEMARMYDNQAQILVRAGVETTVFITMDPGPNPDAIPQAPSPRAR